MRPKSWIIGGAFFMTNLTCNQSKYRHKIINYCELHHSVNSIGDSDFICDNYKNQNKTRNCLK